MELDQLRYAIAVADHGSFGRAAAILGVTQPAVSMAITKLEGELGAQLFVRRGQGSTPTPTGESVLRAARRAIREIEAVQAVATHATPDARTLYVATTSVFIDVVAAVVARLRAARPALRVVVETYDGIDALASLQTGRFDVAVSRLVDVADELVATPIGTDEYFAAFPLHLLADPPESVTLHDLAKYPLIGPRAGTATRIGWDAWFREAGLQPAVAIEALSPEATVALVAAGVGVALTSRFTMRRLAAHVVTVPIRPTRRAPFGVVRPRDAPAAALLFEELAVGIAPELLVATNDDTDPGPAGGQ